MDKIKKKRECPLCDGKKSDVLHVQKFSNYFNHVIACCKDCGFVFVNNIPSQRFYNRYYRNMSKYEIERDHNVHRRAVKLVLKHCGRSAKILDVGCSTGHLLYLLKGQGFKNLYGIDPSPQCRKIASNKFGLAIGVADIAAFKPKHKYEFIILSSVLEHLREVSGSMKKVDSWLIEGGKILIIVPDAENFYKDFVEPFGEFSTEHINFFSQASLCRLMKNYACLQTFSDGEAIYSVWQKGSELYSSISKYISESVKKMREVSHLISICPREVIVWGAGSLTQRLLENTSLGEKVVKFVDKNERLVGKKLRGIEIISPDNLPKYNYPILISSFRFKKEIIQEIRSRKLQNKIIHF